MVYKEITIPDESDLFFIGDIHGCWDEFQSTLICADVEDTDYVISVGDLIDRGPKNAKCLMEFLDNSNRLFVRGNHEDLMMKGLYSREHYHCWYQNGGDVTLDEIGEQGMFIFSKMLEEVPIFLEVNHRGRKYLVVHAGIKEQYSDINIIKSMSNDPIFQESAMWDRSVIDKALRFPDRSDVLYDIRGVDFAIHGHTGTDGPLISGNRVWIDTKYIQGTLTLAKAVDTGLNFYTEIEDCV